MHKRTITVGTVLGAGLLGSLFALGQESVPRPRPVAPPPQIEDVLPKPSAKPSRVPDVISPSLPDVPTPSMLPEPKESIQPVQYVEPKNPLPAILKESETPLPAPLPPTPPSNSALPPPNVPPISASPLPVPALPLDGPKIDSSPANASPVKDAAPTPIPPPVPMPAFEAPPPQLTPSAPDNTPKSPSEGTSRFIVAPRTPQPIPAPAPKADPVMSAPAPTQQAASTGHGIPYFQPVGRPVSAPQTPSRAPGPLPKIYDTVRPTVPDTHTAPAEPLTGVATPQLTVEKRGPLFHKVGEPLKYQIVLRNVGTITAQTIRVEDDIPGAQLVGAMPPTTSQNSDRIIWILPSLRAGEEKIFVEELQPLRPGDVVSTTSVHVFASTSFRTKLDGDVPAPPVASTNIVPTPAPPGPLLMPQPSQTAPTPIQPAPAPIFKTPASDPVDPGPPLTPPTTALPPPSSAPPVAVVPQQMPMTVEVKALPIVAVGKKLVFEVMVKNISAATLTKLELFGTLPRGLVHPQGDNIGADLPDIAPGETKAFKMPVTAALPGKYTVEIRVKAAPNFELVARPVITVEGSGLTIQQSGNSKLSMGRDNEIKIIVANNNARPALGVEVVDVLPEGLEFVAGSDQPNYAPTTRTVSWKFDTIAAGASRSITVRVQPRQPGNFPHEVTARAEELPEAKSANLFEAEFGANLNVRLMGRDSAIAEGSQSTCGLRITNTSGSAATNVQAVITLSEGLEFTSDPPQLLGGTYRIVGRDLVFGPLPKLQNGGAAMIYFAVRGTKTGDQAIRTQVVSDQSRSPIGREERLKVTGQK